MKNTTNILRIVGIVVALASAIAAVIILIQKFCPAKGCCCTCGDCDDEELDNDDFVPDAKCL